MSRRRSEPLRKGSKREGITDEDSPPIFNTFALPDFDSEEEPDERIRTQSSDLETETE